MTISADVSEVRAFAVELGKVAGGDFPAVEKAVKEAAEQACDEAAADASGSRSFARVGASWTSDRASVGLGEVAYEAGPDKRKDRAAGLLGAYFGWPNGGGGTLDLEAPLKAVERPLLDALGAALERVL